ncbi:MAG: mannose-1-phosphate guanylyltransferase/mannose-6-phosphate isomerase [Rhizobiaceae bacterium]|nr:mannose-1-phosphate guanylyltransferase/mannose-6-phosphate isomerase [Rhizobiaceae bacterium]
MKHTSETSTIIPVIMAGGAGTRLWPISRETMPKQFIALMNDGLSTFQAALKRVSGPEFGAPVVITGNDFRFIVAEQMQAVGVKGQIVLEPERRDSAAAVAVGALLAARHGEGATCLILAADHIISDEASFVSDCVLAARAAAGGRIMTLGIAPDRPATAYGYIAVGKPLAEENAFAVDRFVEKPDAETAARYISEGMVWNSGNFVFSPQTMLTELAAGNSDILKAVEQSLDKAIVDLDFLRLDTEAFRKAPKTSIDYAVMERAKNVGVIRASFDWSDVGAWDALYEITAQNDDGNVLDGPVVAMDTHGSLIRSEGALTAVIGLDNVVVVNTPDAVLVASRDKAPMVKDMVAQLAKDGRSEAVEHLRIHRPWGWYQRIDIGDRFQVKHICVKPGGTLSLQRHHHRAEHWVVVHGTAEVTIDGVVKLYHENEAAYLPIGCVHRMRNPGKIDLKIVEVQVGSYTGEDDIVRIEDIYARS